MIRFSLFLAALTVVALLLGPAAGQDGDLLRRDAVGSVYTMSNSGEGNRVLVFDRTAHGLLTPAGSYSTGGLGSGDGLGNQGAVLLSADERWLFVVNAGSDEVSVFRVTRDGLELVEVSGTGGVRPISVTAHRDFVYVLNAGGQVGGTDNIAGFRLDSHGQLSHLEGSVQPLSADSTAPAQIEFSPDGRFLVVTEKATSIIDLYAVGHDGLAGEPTPYESAAPTPFGFAFGKRGQVFVSEAAGGAPDGSSVSSYQISRDGELQLISSAIPTTETAACWLVVSNDGRFAYTTNGGSASVSGYAIDFDGVISLLDENGETGTTGETPLDMAFSTNSRYLYTLNVGDGTLSAFRFQADGSLLPLRGINGLPTGVNGLAAR
jgi:6-phosphogluconolactonase (cycloisomerase 2 family)